MEQKSRVFYEAGSFKYELQRNWAKWPKDMWNCAVCGITVMQDGTVVAATRSAKYPIVFLDADGNYLKSIGNNLEFARTHGVTLDKDETIWVCDDQRSVVYHLSQTGEVIEMLGQKDVFSNSGYDPTVRWPHDLYTNIRAAEPFNRPTRMARAPWGDYYCSDGYGNTAVHRFDDECKLKYTWGGPGNEPGKFRLPHAVAFDDRERVWVCDRENFRIQIFDKDGNFLHQIERLGYPSEMTFFENHMYVCEGDGMVGIYDMNYQRIATIGYAGCFSRIHSMSLDGKGNIYLGRIEGEDSLFKLNLIKYM